MSLRSARRAAWAHARLIAAFGAAGLGLASAAHGLTGAAGPERPDDPSSASTTRPSEARTDLLTGASAPARDVEPDEYRRPLTADESETLRRLSDERGATWRLLPHLALGSGLRLNNPFRLSTQLGDTPESLSLLPTYADFGCGVTAGRADGVQHGAAIDLVAALSGVPQTVLVPSYLLVHRGGSRFMLHARAGLPVVTTPKTNVGFEGGAGAAYFVTSGIGARAELVADLYWGAATHEVSFTVHPLISAQLGVVFDLETLP